MKRPVLLVLLLVGLGLSGCVDKPGEYDLPLSETGFKVPRPINTTLAAADITWPSLHNATLSVVVVEDAPWFKLAADRFQAITGATVTKKTGTAGAVNATDGDLVYGLDSFTLRDAIERDALREYRPQLAQRVDRAHRFFDPLGAWHATPTDHGLVGIFVEQGDGANFTDVFDLRSNATAWGITPETTDPVTKHLMAIFAGHFGEGAGYTHVAFWRELTRGSDNKLCTGDEIRHKPNDKVQVGTLLDHDIEDLLEDRLALPIVRTTGILAGTGVRAAAEAWVEFTLTDDFQNIVRIESNPVVGKSTFDKGLFADFRWATLEEDQARWAAAVQPIFDTAKTAAGTKACKDLA